MVVAADGSGVTVSVGTGPNAGATTSGGAEWVNRVVIDRGLPAVTTTV